VLAHGAGAGSRHPFLERVAAALAERAVATWRFDFPYMAAGRKLPDRPPVLEEAVRAQVARARAAAPDLPLLAGGKSMGGRMTSRAQAAGPLDGVRGLAFLGFPLHRPRQPARERAAHLAAVAVPMLFVQGSRDALAELPLLGAAIGAARLHVIEGADHAFAVRGRAQGEVIAELADAVARFAREL
jgi:uncharacterized protein